MDKPIIGITCSRDMLGSNQVQYAHDHYIEAVIKAGGIPLILPICHESDMKQQAKHIDGLLVTGGIDVNPMFYHEPCHVLQGESDMKRDEYEMALIQETANLHKPILGICRGQQIINVAFKGTLYQDNRLKDSNVYQHVQKERKEYPSHSIDIDKESFLYPIFGKTAYVNSFHHQSIKKTAKGFQVIARSDDGIIEAIEHHTLPIWAVQFHPEKMLNTDHKMLEIFKCFIQMCKK